MATKKTPVERIRKRLAELSDAVPQDLRLASLKENRLEGYSYLFRVLTSPIEAANQFFASLKPILKTAGHFEQQEILISRIECRLT
jgi:hypothetical protein